MRQIILLPIAGTLGMSCILDIDCSSSIGNSSCMNSSCDCNPGFYSVGDNTTCSPIYIGVSCESTYECRIHVNDSLCDNGTCQCQSGYFGVDNGEACIRLRLGFGTCASSESCVDSIANSTCNNNSVCACLPGFRNESDTCLLRQIGDECVSNDDCILAVDNSICNSSTCICDWGYEEMHNNSVCTLRRVGVSDCASHADCTYAVSHSQCLTGTCQCSRGYQSSANGTDCVPIAINDTCSIDEDCLVHIQGADCKHAFCSCLVGYAEMNSYLCEISKFTLFVVYCRIAVFSWRLQYLLLRLHWSFLLATALKHVLLWHFYFNLYP